MDFWDIYEQRKGTKPPGGNGPKLPTANQAKAVGCVFITLYFGFVLSILGGITYVVIHFAKKWW